MATGGRAIRELERKVNELQGFKMHDELGLMPETMPISEDEMSYISIASALAHRYDSIYYVNLTNNHYVEYVSSASYKELRVETGGDDFFADSARNIRRVVHPDDVSYALQLHDKEFILKELDKDNLIAFTYRIMFDGEPHFYHGRITRNLNDPNHLIIGWANVDSQIRREQELEEAQSENYISKSVTQALLSDYTSVYYVDIHTEEYREWTPEVKTGELVLSGEGEHYFNYMISHVKEVVYAPDASKHSAMLNMDAVLTALEGGPFVCSYRVQEADRLVWHTLKIVYAAEKTHILVSVRDVDEQKRREAEYESQLLSMSAQISKDGLTAVKNKFAYLQAEQAINERLAREKSSFPFGIVVCDLNDLKKVNDTSGHKAGDQLIIAAAHLISDIFKYSPVYRIGGDEFAVVLTGRDYEHRNGLMQEMLREEKHTQNGERPLSLSRGLAVFDPAEDNCFDDVFTRADRRMYENKRAYKADRNR